MGDHRAMASRDHQSQVIDLVADERGLSREKLHFSDRLLEDLGMDGDDAVDFFDDLHERFGTDLTYLYEHWSEHFGPEGFSCWNGLVIIPAAITGGALAGAARLSAFWAMAITLALLITWSWLTRRLEPSGGTKPITIGDVVAAVEAGEWPSPPHA